MELVENAYPDTAYPFKVELARDQVIQGVVVSNDIREKLFISQPGSLVETVRVVRQLESTRKACQAAPSVEKKQSLSVVSTSAGNERISTEIRELKEFVLGMNEKGTGKKKRQGQQQFRGAVMTRCAILTTDKVTLRGNVQLKYRET